MKTDKVFLTRSWRALSSEVDALLNEQKFHDTFPGSAARLPRLLEGMQKVAQEATVNLTPEVEKVENVFIFDGE